MENRISEEKMKALKASRMGKAMVLGVLVSWSLGVCVMSGTAWAQEVEPGIGAHEKCFGPQEDVPEAKAAAQVLLGAGNLLMAGAKYEEALAKYEEALSKCDHPAVHFNMALALRGLDRPVEMYREFTLAMKYGAGPIGRERFENARVFRQYLEQQLAQVSIKSDLVGVRVTMDGQDLFTSPGIYEGLVRGGQHVLAATKQGYLPNQVTETFSGGTELSLELKESAQIKRRWPTAAWKTWALAGAGAAVGITGGVLLLVGNKDIRDYESGIRDRCGRPGCGHVPNDLQSKRSTGNTLQKLGVGAAIVGGAGLATGAVLIYLNRPHPYPTSKFSASPNAEKPISITPVLQANGCGINAAFNF